MSHTPEQVLAAAKVLYPEAHHIEKCGLSTDIRNSKGHRLCVVGPEIEWNGLVVFPGVNWRPAVFPKDWGKKAYCTDSDAKPEPEGHTNVVLIGYDPAEEVFVDDDTDTWNYCWVVDDEEKT